MARLCRPTGMTKAICCNEGEVCRLEFVRTISDFVVFCGPPSVA